MQTEPLIRTPSPVRDTHQKGAPSRSRPVQVYMMDLLSIVPYYTGHLSAALRQRQDIDLCLGAITYHLDPSYFSRENLTLQPGLNLVSKLPSRPAFLRKLLKTIEYLFNLAALLVRFSFHRPDVVHVQFLPMLIMGIPLEILFLQMVRLLGIPLVYTVHNLLPHDTAQLRRSLYRRVYRIPDALICHDQVVQDRLIAEFGVARNRTHVIPHGPLLRPSTGLSREQARCQLGVTNDQVLYLWQGIIRPYKGVSFLLKTWEQVQAANSNARLAIVGTGDTALTKAILDEVKSLDISRSVKLELRFVTTEELERYYEAADVLVYPYSQITTSGALMTGLGYGKAIVTTKLGAFESLLSQGRNAFMVPYGDVESLAQTLLCLAAEPTTRRQLGEAARRTYLECQSWQEIASGTSSLYQAVLHGE